ncbi:MAG TPA: T9SS type A sorting domain-containing protein, partial [Puia sp.]|nr:T9SS type A sorting domain-containing protein [Puia sp.]
LTQAQVISNFKHATKTYGAQFWTVIGDQDSYLGDNVAYHDSLNYLSPATADKLTILHNWSHGPWDGVFDTLYRPTANTYTSTAACGQNGCPANILAPGYGNDGSISRGSGVTQDSLNLYEWFLCFSKGTPDTGSSTPPDTTSCTYAPPTVAIDSNRTLQLPLDSAFLTSTNTVTCTTLSSITWTKFKAPGQAMSRLGVLGSSTSAGGGSSTFDSSYVGRLKTFYISNGIVDSVVDLAQYGYNPYQAMPTGYVPPADVTTKLAPSDTPDPNNNITALLAHHPTHVIINFPTNGFDVLTMPEIMFPLQYLADTLTSLGITWYITTTQPRSDEAFNTPAKQQFLQVVRDSILNRFGSHAIDFYDNMVQPGTTYKIPGYDAGDSIHFNDAGHLQLFRQVVGTNIFQNAATSAASIASPSTANTWVKQLPKGVNVFEVTVLDSHAQKNSAIVSVTVDSAGSGGGGGTDSTHPGCGSGHRWEITPNADTAFWACHGCTPDVTAFQPGDTLAFASTNSFGNYWTYITLDGFKGNPACPLVMINEGGQTWVRGYTVTITNSSYVKFTGGGVAGTKYGWLITGNDPTRRPQGPFGMAVNGRSHNVDIDSVSIHNTGLGIQIQTDPDCADSLDYPNWVLDSMFIHDNSIVGVWNEGMYIGNTSPDNASYDPRPVTCNGQTVYPIPMKNGYTKIWNNYIDSTGRGGIQLANADSGMSEIANNTVKHSGMNGDDAQGTGISVGLYTHAYIHDNTISDTYTWAIASIGACGTNIPIRIENNHTDSSGFLQAYNLGSTDKQSINPATEPTYPDSLTYPYAIWVDTRQRVYTTDNPPGTAVHGQDSTQFWIKGNVIGRFKCYTSTRDNTSAIQIEDHALGLQSTGNIICGNTSSVGDSIRVYTGNAAHTVYYDSSCGAAPDTSGLVGRQLVDSFPADPWGDLDYGLTWLPPTYAGNPGKAYPLIISLHSYQQAGSGRSAVSKLITAGLPSVIAGGWNPYAVNPASDSGYEFIVVSPQDPSFTPNYNALKYILPNVLSRYRIDSTRIYLTGFAAGGDGVFTCLGSGDSSFIKKIAAVATSSSFEADGVNGLTAGQVEHNLRYASKAYGVRVWTTGGDGDGLYGTQVRYHDSVNILSPTPANKLTLLSGLDTTWNLVYDSSYRPTMNYYGNTANCASGCPSITSSASSSSPARGSGRTQDSLNVFEWFLLSQKIGNGPFPEGAVSKLSSGLATQLDSLDDGTELIHVYPNPVVSGNITLTVQNDALGKVLVTLMDPSGRVVQENVFIKNSALFMQQVMLPGGMKGVYLMKVQIQGKAPAVFKLLKE